MRYNGLQLVVRMAVAKLQEPLLTRFEEALILGSIREDVLYLKSKKKIWEHWSLSHFSGPLLRGGFLPLVYPGAPAKAQGYFTEALRCWRRHDPARAFVQLGRASHLLADMACPVHASRVAHWNDGYEWYIEAHYARLMRLDFTIPSEYGDAHQIIDGLARFTQKFQPDRTNHHWGHWLKSMGLRKAPTRADFSMQAEQIIPVAAGHLAALYQKFLVEIHQE